MSWLNLKQIKWRSFIKIDLLILVILVFVLANLQFGLLSSLPLIKYLNFFLVLIVFLAFWHDEPIAFIGVFLAGLVTDWYSVLPYGINLFIFINIFFLLKWIYSNFFTHLSIITFVLLVAVSGAFYYLFYYLANLLFLTLRQGIYFASFQSYLSMTFSSIILNVILGIIIFYIFSGYFFRINLKK